jgi:predicted transposase YdaD
MKESVTDQAILEEGEAQGRAKGLAKGRLTEAKKLVRLLGENRFGPPDAQTATILAGIKDLPRLEELLVRLLHVGGWQELLGLPGQRSSRKRRPNR